MNLDINITDRALLKKAIQILSCIIHGHSIRALLRKETKFFSQETNADLITIYIQKDGGHKIDFLSDKKRLYCRLMEKYGFNKHSPSFGQVGTDIINGFSYTNPMYETSDIYALLKGTVTKKECEIMKKEIRFKTAQFFPLRLIHGKKIGFVAYFYTREKKPDTDKLKEVSSLIQRVIEPLYDANTATFYSKCAQIDTDMSRLTDKEKEIVHRVIKGVSYKEIASELNISINTLKTHMKSVFSKYGVNSKIELNNKLAIHMR